MTERRPGTAEAEAEGPAESPSAGARRWYRRRGVIVAVLLAWAGIGAYLLFGLFPDDVPEDEGRGPGAEEVPAPLLWVVRGPAEEPPAMALVHADPEEPVVVLLPVGTVLEVPGQGPRSLEAALGESGSLGVGTSVANALGIEVPRAVVASPEQLVGLVDALGPVEVDVPETVEVEEGGVLRRVFTEGKTEMGGEAFLTFLTRAVPEQRETDRVARQGAAWRGLLEAFAETGAGRLAGLLEGWDSEAAPDQVAGVLVDVAAEASGPRVLTLPVRRSPAPGDLYELQGEELDFLQEALGSIRTVEDPEGRRIRLLVGAEGQVGPVVARSLIEAGYRIVLTGRASRPYDVTRAVMAENSDELRETAEELLGLLGTGELGVYERRQTVFDVTLVVGRDWAEANGFPQPEPASGDE